MVQDYISLSFPVSLPSSWCSFTSLYKRTTFVSMNLLSGVIVACVFHNTVNGVFSVRSELCKFKYLTNVIICNRKIC